MRLTIPTLLAVVIGACAQLEGDAELRPFITTSGPHSVAVGESIEIIATTANGADSRYEFESSDPSLASVTSSGIVFGLVPGETSVAVRGVSSGATAEHVVVVTLPTEGSAIPPARKRVATATTRPTAGAAR